MAGKHKTSSDLEGRDAARISIIDRGALQRCRCRCFPKSAKSPSLSLRRHECYSYSTYCASYGLRTIGGALSSTRARMCLALLVLLRTAVWPEAFCSSAVACIVHSSLPSLPSYGGRMHRLSLVLEPVREISTVPWRAWPASLWLPTATIGRKGPFLFPTYLRSMCSVPLLTGRWSPRWRPHARSRCHKELRYQTPSRRATLSFGSSFGLHCIRDLHHHYLSVSCFMQNCPSSA